MKIILIGLALIISTALIAQDNPAVKQPVNSASSTSVSSKKANNNKVHYVNKRTKPVQNNSKNGLNSQNKKKPVIHKSENQGKTVSK